MKSADLCAFALQRALVWREAWRRSTTAGARVLCRSTMRKMALVWRREYAKRGELTYSACSFRQASGRAQRSA